MKGNGTSISDGDTSPSTGDDTDFGSADVSGGSTSHTFTVENTGSANLNLSGSPKVSVSGSNAGDFTVTTQPSSPVAANGTTTFVVEFDPSSTGTRSATLSIANNDSNENPYNFSLEGTGTDSSAPEMNVKGNGTSISDGDTSPNTGDDTDFGSVDVSSGTESHTFTIENTGTADLDLSGSPKVAVSGSNAGDFSVTTQPSSPVAANGTTTFVVEFDPSSTGTRSATLSIANNDSNENPYNFSIQGTGTDSSPGDLLVHWKLNHDGANNEAVDTSGNGNTGLVSGASWVTGGKYQGALDFNANSSNYVLDDDGETYLNGLDEITVMMWIKSNSANTDRGFLFGKNPNGSDSGLAMRYDAAGWSGGGTKVIKAAVSTTGGNVVIESVSNVQTTAWQHVAVTWQSGGALKLYLDGVEDTNTTYNSGAKSGTVTGLEKLLVGRGPKDSNSSWDGLIDDVRIYGRALSASEVVGAMNDDGSPPPTAPEMNVKGNGTSISDGDTSPSTGDDTDFGSADVSGGSTSHTFTVENTGDADLNLSGSPKVAVSGSNAGDFSVTTQPSSPVAANGTTTFVVEFDPSGTGTRSATLSITNNDSNENPYTFSLEGTGTDSSAPEMNVKGNGTSISDGDTSPSTGDDTDFGSADVSGGSTSHTFTVENTGDADLNLSGSPKVAVSGSNAGDFTVTTQPSSPVAANGTTTFVVEFDPSGTGTRSATLSIANNDSNENPYTFSIQGTGTSSGSTLLSDNFDDGNMDGWTIVDEGTVSAPSNWSVVSGEVKQSSNIYDGDPQDADDRVGTFAYWDETAALSWTDYTVELTVRSSDNDGIGVMVYYQDADNYYRFEMDNQRTFRKLIKKVNGTVTLLASDLTTGYTQNQDYELSVEVGNGEITVSLDGSPLFGGAVSDSDLSEGTVALYSWGDTGAFYDDVVVTGSGSPPPTAPEMNVKGNGTSISDGDTSPSTGDDTDFGSADVSGGSTSHTFTVENTGDADLNLSGSPKVAVSGSNAGDFSVTTQPSSPVAANGTTTFVVEFDPSSTGTRSATLSIANNDSNETPYTFSIQGTGTSSGTTGEISREVWTGVSGTSVSQIPTGTTPDVTDTLTSFEAVDWNNSSDNNTWANNYGTRVQGYLHAPETGNYIFWISTDDNSELWLSTDDSEANKQLIAQQPDWNPWRIWNDEDDQRSDLFFGTVSLTAGQRYYIEALQKENTGGDHLAVAWRKPSDTGDPDNGSDSHIIPGSVLEIFGGSPPPTAPEINVKGNGTDIADGDTSPSTGDDTDFGSADVSGGSTSHTFTVENTGDADLNLSGSPKVAVSGSNAGDFTVTTQPSSPVAANGTTTFVVEFDPSGTGTRSATLSITNNDSNENPYTFSIQGTGTDSSAPEMNVKGNGTSISDGDTSPSTGDDTDFGSADVSGGSTSHTFTVENTGSANLNLSGSPKVAVSGSNAGDFSVTTQPSSPVAANGTTTFVVEFDPSGTGTRSATLSITNNDSNENPYNFSIQGTGTDTPPPPGGQAFRVTEYYLTDGDFTGTTYDLTLDQDLAADYFILVRGSKVSDGGSNPDNDYARVYRVPGGKGDLADSGANDRVSLSRHVADHTWEGVVTVVEALAGTDTAGFKLLDVVETAISGEGTGGTDSSGTAWGDINQVVLFGGYHGGGAEFEANAANSQDGDAVYTRLYPSGSNTLNWTRVNNGSNSSPSGTLKDMTMTTFVVEWGSEWTVQRAYVSGTAAGNGANETGDYSTAAISAVNRDNTWVWGTGTSAGDGIGEDAEGTLITLGDGVTQNTGESSVAMGAEYSFQRDFDVYVMSHTDLAVDYRFKGDGDSTVLDKAVTVDSAATGQRLALVYNGCNGSGSAHPRDRFWARYTADNEVTISRGYSGQNYPAWVQGVDFSGIEAGPVSATAELSAYPVGGVAPLTSTFTIAVYNSRTTTPVQPVQPGPGPWKVYLPLVLKGTGSGPDSPVSILGAVGSQSLAAGTYDYSLDFGDGSTPATGSFSNGTTDVNHIYTVDGVYTATAHLTGAGTLDTNEVVIHVGNRPPRVFTTSVTMEKNAIVEVDLEQVLAYDLDLEDLDFSITGGPSNGVAEIIQSRQVLSETAGAVYTDVLLIYTPTLDYVGNDWIDLEVEDMAGEVRQAAISVTVVSSTFNEPPYADSRTVSFIENDPITIDLSDLAFDPEGDVITFSLVLPSAYGYEDIDGTTLTITPTNILTEVDFLRYRVEDADGYADGDINLFRVTEAITNNAPLADDRSVTYLVDQGAGLDLSTLVVDPEGDSGGDLSYEIIDGPRSGSLNLTGSNLTYNYTATTETAIDPLTYVVTDTQGAASIGHILMIATVDDTVGIEAVIRSQKPVLLSIEPKSVLLETVGATQTVTLRGYNLVGEEVPVRAEDVNWEIIKQDDSQSINFEIEPGDTTKVTVESTAAVGHLQFRATVAEMMSQSAVVMAVQLQPGVEVVPDAAVRSVSLAFPPELEAFVEADDEAGGEAWLAAQGSDYVLPIMYKAVIDNSAGMSFAPDMLVTAGSAPVAGRIVATRTITDGVEVWYAPVEVTEIIYSAEYSATFSGPDLLPLVGQKNEPGGSDSTFGKTTLGREAPQSLAGKLLATAEEGSNAESLGLPGFDIERMEAGFSLVIIDVKLPFGASIDAWNKESSSRMQEDKPSVHSEDLLEKLSQKKKDPPERGFQKEFKDKFKEGFKKPTFKPTGVVVPFVHGHLHLKAGLEFSIENGARINEGIVQGLEAGVKGEIVLGGGIHVTHDLLVFVLTQDLLDMTATVFRFPAFPIWGVNLQFKVAATGALIVIGQTNLDMEKEIAVGVRFGMYSEPPFFYANPTFDWERPGEFTFLAPQDDGTLLLELSLDTSLTAKIGLVDWDDVKKAIKKMTRDGTRKIAPGKEGNLGQNQKADSEKEVYKNLDPDNIVGSLFSLPTWVTWIIGDINKIPEPSFGPSFVLNFPFFKMMHTSDVDNLGTGTFRGYGTYAPGARVRIGPEGGVKDLFLMIARWGGPDIKLLRDWWYVKEWVDNYPGGTGSAAKILNDDLEPVDACSKDWIAQYGKRYEDADKVIECKVEKNDCTGLREWGWEEEYYAKVTYKGDVEREYDLDEPGFLVNTVFLGGVSDLKVFKITEHVKEGGQCVLRQVRPPEEVGTVQLTNGFKNLYDWTWENVPDGTYELATMTNPGLLGFTLPVAWHLLKDTDGAMEDDNANIFEVTVDSGGNGDACGSEPEWEKVETLDYCEGPENIHGFDTKFEAGLCETTWWKRLKAGWKYPNGYIDWTFYGDWMVELRKPTAFCFWRSGYDPHISTMDGKSFDSFSLGEFIYTEPRPGYEEDGVTVQVRQEHVDGWTQSSPLFTEILEVADWTSWNTAVAIQAGVNGPVFEFRLGGVSAPLTVLKDGTALSGNDLAPGLHLHGENDEITLQINNSEDMVLLYNGHRYRITESNDAWLDFEGSGPRDDSHYGLMGRANGDISDDFQYPDGREALDVYDLANGWRILDDEDSLFTYNLDPAVPDDEEGPWDFNQKQGAEPPSREELAPFMDQAESLLRSRCEVGSLDERDVLNVAMELYIGRSPEDVDQIGVCHYRVAGEVANALVSGVVVPGAKVTVSGPGGSECETWTDLDGRYACNLPSTGEGAGEITVEISQRGEGEKVVTVSQLPPANGYLPISADLSVAPTTLRLHGIVEDHTGAALYNAEMRIEGPSVPGSVTKVYTQTNGEGEYQTYLMVDDGVESGSGNYRVSFNPKYETEPTGTRITKDYSRDFSGLVEHSLNDLKENFVLKGVQLRFEGRAAYQFDPSASIAGGRIIIEPVSGDPMGGDCDMTTLVYRSPDSIDEDKPLDPTKETTNPDEVGVYRCEKQTEETAPFDVRVKLIDGTSTLTETVVTVDPAGRGAGETLPVVTNLYLETPVLELRGKVTDPAGNPVAGAAVSADSNDSIVDKVAGKTDVTGWYKLYLPLKSGVTNTTVDYGVSYRHASLQTTTLSKNATAGSASNPPVVVSKDFEVAGVELEFDGRVLDTRFALAPVHGAAVSIKDADTGDYLCGDPATGTGVLETGIHPVEPDIYMQRPGPGEFPPIPKRCKAKTDKFDEVLNLEYVVSNFNGTGSVTLPYTFSLPSLGGMGYVGKELEVTSVPPTILNLDGKVERPGGAIVAGATVSVVAKDGGNVVASGSGRSTGDGDYDIALTIPEAKAQGLSSVNLEYLVKFRTLTETATANNVSVNYQNTAGHSQDLSYPHRTVYFRGSITNTYGITLPVTTVAVSAPELSTNRGDVCITQTDNRNEYFCVAETQATAPFSVTYIFSGTWGSQVYTETVTVNGSEDQVELVKDGRVDLTALRLVGQVSTLSGDPLGNVELTVSGEELYRTARFTTTADGLYEAYVLMQPTGATTFTGQLNYRVGYGEATILGVTGYEATENETASVRKDFELGMRVMTFKGTVRNSLQPAGQDDLYGTIVRVVDPAVGQLCEYAKLERFSTAEYECSGRIFSTQPFSVEYHLSGEWGSMVITGTTITDIPALGERKTFNKVLNAAPTTLKLSGQVTDNNNVGLQGAELEIGSPEMISGGEDVAQFVVAESDGSGNYSVYAVLKEGVSEAQLNYSLKYGSGGQEHLLNRTIEVEVNPGELTTLPAENFQFPLRKVTFKGDLNNSTDSNVPLSGALRIVSSDLDQVLCETGIATKDGDNDDYRCEALVETDDGFNLEYQVSGYWGSASTTGSVGASTTNVNKDINASPRVLSLSGDVKDAGSTTFPEAVVKLYSYDFQVGKRIAPDVVVDSNGHYTAKVVLGDGVDQTAVFYEAEVKGNTVTDQHTFSGLSGSTPTAGRDLTLTTGRIIFTGALANSLRTGEEGNWSDKTEIYIDSTTEGFLCDSRTEKSFEESLMSQLGLDDGENGGEYECTATVEPGSTIPLSYTIYSDWGSAEIGGSISAANLPAVGGVYTHSVDLSVTPTMLKIVGTASYSYHGSVNPLTDTAVMSKRPMGPSSPLVSSQWDIVKTGADGSFEKYVIMKDQAADGTISLIFEGEQGTFVKNGLSFSGLTAGQMNTLNVGSLQFEKRDPDDPDPSSTRYVNISVDLVSAQVPGETEHRPAQWWLMESPSYGTICEVTPENPQDQPTDSLSCEVAVDNTSPFEVRVYVYGEYGPGNLVLEVPSDDIPDVGQRLTVEEELPLETGVIHLYGRVIGEEGVPVEGLEVEVETGLSVLDPNPDDEEGPINIILTDESNANGLYDRYLLLPAVPGGTDTHELHPAAGGSGGGAAGSALLPDQNVKSGAIERLAGKLAIHLPAGAVPGECLEPIGAGAVAGRTGHGEHHLAGLYQRRLLWNRDRFGNRLLRV